MKFYFKVWEIIISWDILTLNENIDVACKTQGVRQERTDFQVVITYRDFQVVIHFRGFQVVIHFLDFQLGCNPSQIPREYPFRDFQ